MSKTANLARNLIFPISAWLFICAPHASAQSVGLDLTSSLPDTVHQAILERLPDEAAAKTSLQARRQARRSKTLISDTLNSYGYYDPDITISVIEETGRPKPILVVSPGARFTIGRALLKFIDPAPRAEDVATLETWLPIKPGMIAIPGEIIDAERGLAVQLRKLGYALTETPERDVIGDKDASTISVRYTVNSGPRIRYGDIIYPENVRTQQSYLERLSPVTSGQIYEPAILPRYKSRLSESRLYSSSQVSLAPTSNGTSQTGDAIYDVVISLTERPRNTIALGGSYDTNDGFGVGAELTKRNFTRRGDTLVATAQLAERETRLDTVWRAPSQFGYGKGLVLKATALDEQTDAYDQTLGRIGIGYEYIANRSFNYNYGVNAQIIRQVETDTPEDFQTVSGYAGLNIDHSDSLLDPRQGWRASAEVQPTYAFGEETEAQYVRAVAQARAYLPVGQDNRFVLAGRLRLGSVIGAGLDDIPVESRFYAGGGGSIRGYGYQAVGPKDADNDATGGRSLIDGSIEARWRYNDKIGVVGFIDGGDASDSEYPTFDTVKLGAGIGARYQTPAGPIRFDIAVPLDKSESDDDFQLYISIGQAF